MRWQLDDLTYFCAIVDSGGITGAARRLDCPKSTVSKALSRLERDLGIKLVERTSRRVSVTEEGKAFYARAGAIMELAHEADTFIQGMRAAPAGKVRLALPAAFAREILAPRLVEFTIRYPAIELEIQTNATNPDVIGGACDVAVVVGQQADSTLSHKVLLGGRLIWITSPAYAQRHAIGPDTPLDSHHIAIAESRYSREALAMHIGAEAQKLTLNRKVVRITDPLCVRAAVESGLGVSFLPERYCHASIAQGSLVEVWRDARFDQEAARMAIVYSGQRLLSPRFRAVIGFLQEICNQQKQIGSSTS